MSTDGAAIPARRWPRVGLAGLTCALLVGLGLICGPAARAAHGPAQPHRPVGKVFVTSDAPGAGMSVWHHTPDQDVATEHHAVATVRWISAEPDQAGVATRHVACVRSRGPPGLAG